MLPFDWVRIGDVEGRVIETNWRETRLQTHGGHVLVVPNSTVANATIHNMSRPTPRRRHSLPVGAGYADPSRQRDRGPDSVDPERSRSAPGPAPERPGHRL